MPMAMDTFFGYFARAVLVAFGSTLSQPPRGKKSSLTLERMQVWQATAFSLRRSGFERMFAPILHPNCSLRVLFAMQERDVALMKPLCGAGVEMHQNLERAFSASIEPLAMVARQRDLFQGLETSPNALGFSAHHLNGALTYTAAQGWFAPTHHAPFSLCLLVNAHTRDVIEERSAQHQTLRALKTIVEGTYVCQPQIPPPNPAQALDQGVLVNAQTLRLAWLHSMFCANATNTLPKLLRRTAAVRCQLLDTAAWQGDTFWSPQDTTQPLTAVRLGLKGHKATMLVFFAASQAKLLLQLSKSGQASFLGGFLRTLFAASAQAYSHLSGRDIAWQVVGVGTLEHDKANAWLNSEGQRGMLVKQTLQFEGATVFWLLAITAPVLQHLLTTVGTPLGVAAKQVLPTLGFHQGHPPLQILFAALSPQHAIMTMRHVLQHLQAITQPDTPSTAQPNISRKASTPIKSAATKHSQASRAKPSQALLDCLATALASTHGQAQATLAQALPQHLGEQVKNTPSNPNQKNQHLRWWGNALARVWIDIQTQSDFPHNALSAWGALYAEALWALREETIERLLPLRMFVFGAKKPALRQWLVLQPKQQLATALCGVPFSLLDQVRRVLPPAFGLHLLEDLGSQQQKINALQAQQSQIALLTRGAEHLAEGRLALTPTTAKNLNSLVKALQPWL